MARVQNQTLGHRGRKHDPLYRARKLLVSASENVTYSGRTRLRGLLDAGDPYGEVRDAWHAKETLRSVYDIPDAELGAASVAQLAADLQDPGLPPRSTGSAAPSGAGEPRSPTGTPPESPTPPPKRPTTSSNGSNEPRSASPTSPTLIVGGPCWRGGSDPFANWPSVPCGRSVGPSRWQGAHRPVGRT